MLQGSRYLQGPHHQVKVTRELHPQGGMRAKVRKSTAQINSVNLEFECSNEWLV